MKQICFFTILTILISAAGTVFAASTEDLVQKVSQAANAAARRDVNGVVNSAISGAGVNLGNQGRIDLRASGASFYQGVPPIGTYNANAYISSNGSPAVGQNFSANTGTRYVRNITTFSLADR